MGFTQAIKTVLRDKYATFKGRASRSEYWWFQLFNFLLILVFFGVLTGISATVGKDNPDGMSIPILVGGGLIYLLVMIVPLLALQVRRFHDRNMSGWWYLMFFLAGFIPVVGKGTGLAVTIISCLKGTDGPNSFGPDPLRPNVTADIFA